MLSLAGCLSTSPVETSEWTVEYPVRQVAAGEKGEVRISQVTVRSPYDSQGIVVLRASGTVAVDPFNRFAAVPSQLLKGPVEDAFRSSGKFSSTVGSSSAASVVSVAEVSVSRIALDCREEGSRKAVVSLAVRLLDRSRRIVSESRGEGSADAAAGNYTEAFSQAFMAAIEAALKGV